MADAFETSLSDAEAKLSALQSQLAALESGAASRLLPPAHPMFTNPFHRPFLFPHLFFLAALLLRLRYPLTLHDWLDGGRAVADGPGGQVLAQLKELRTQVVKDTEAAAATQAERDALAAEVSGLEGENKQLEDQIAQLRSSLGM
jgi:hypothetical protein